MRIPCPIQSCPGEVVSKRIDGLGAVMGCTGPEAHGDATIRLAIIRQTDDEVAETESEMAEITMRLEPIEYLRDQVKRSTERGGGGVVKPPETMLVRPPSYPTGLRGIQTGRLPNYLGMTMISGKASTGKSWSAQPASFDATAQGWDVHYLCAEGVAAIHERAKLLAPSGTPDRWTLRIIEDGSTVQDICDYVAGAIASERTLIVIDSFSTMLRMLDPGVGETWGLQRQLERFLFNIRQFTAGCVAPLVISEANAAGETKGRSFDHLADLSVNFRSDEDEPELKHIRVAKSWWSRTGDVGQYRVSVTQGGPVRVRDDETAEAEAAARADDWRHSGAVEG